MSALLAKDLIRDIPDFPKEGIIFKDITPVLADPAAFREVAEKMTLAAERMKPTVVVGIESRGFIFGAPVALRLALPFALVRKMGKLPYQTVAEEYALEYGTNTVEIHEDAVGPGDRVLVVDDLLATGGTAMATARLVEKCGASVAGFLFLVELAFLPGRHALRGYEIEALIDY
ncbi:MAG TPA: adenine phosphoribosyltransferase [Fimbriimonadales bacterium]|jgi:adenine phosphoribosyltransferase|nr:adenine phosphoribosyltransferase [Fimbriimonadales bacterium]